MSKLKFIGIFIFLLGFGFLISGSRNITGFIISNFQISSEYFFIFGLAMMFVGFLLMIIREDLEERTDSGLEVITTTHFLRAIKKHDVGAINRAIKKIGTGKGGEEKLRKGGYAVRVLKDSRVIYEMQEGRVVLRDYIPHHEYSRAL